MTKKNKLLEKLIIDPEKEAEKIKNFILSEVKRLKKEGVVIGLSGGLNSSTVAYLCKSVLKKERILGLILPERDSDPRNIEDARMIAREFDLSVKEMSLSPLLKKMGVYKLGVEKIPQNRKLTEKLVEKFQKSLKEPSLFASGFPFFFGKKIERKGKIGKAILKYEKEVAALVTAKTRLRMLLLYYFSALNDSLVCGTSDKTEWSIGYYEGDAICDIQPLVHLYKTQIRQLAHYLRLSPNILEKPSSGDLFGKGLANEIVVGLSYELLDSILYGLNNKYSIKGISELTGATEKQIKAIFQLVETDKTRKTLPSSL